MQVKLLVELGNTRVREVVLRRSQTFVGRQKGCGLRIPAASVSRRHCLLQIGDGVLTVEDLDSVNGTFVNGNRVQGRQVVRPGDSLEIGPVRFRVEYPAGKKTKARSKDKGVQQPTLDVVPLADEEAVTVQAVALEELPAEAPKKPAGLTEVVPTSPQHSDDIPLAVDVEEAPDMQLESADIRGWQLPEGDQLRDLLAQMDAPPGKKRPPGKGKKS